MRKDPLTRLGAKGAWQVRSHPWFSVLDWDNVMSRKVAPPFKPHLQGELDVGNFAEEFTGQDPVDSPAQPPRKHNELFRVSTWRGTKLFNYLLYKKTIIELICCRKVFVFVTLFVCICTTILFFTCSIISMYISFSPSLLPFPPPPLSPVGVSIGTSPLPPRAIHSLDPPYCSHRTPSPHQ